MPTAEHRAVQLFGLALGLLLAAMLALNAIAF